MSHPTNSTRLLATLCALRANRHDVPALLALASDALDAAIDESDDLAARERIAAAAAVVGVLPGGPGLSPALAESLVRPCEGRAHGGQANDARGSTRPRGRRPA